MATKTADAAHDFVSPRSNYFGPTTVIGSYVANGNTISSGDVFWMVKIPHGAVITGLQWFGRSASTGGIVFNIGTPASPSLFGPATISATHQFINLTAGASATQNFPYTNSLSDDAVTRFVPLTATVASGTATATGSFGLLVTYLMPGNAGP